MATASNWEKRLIRSLAWNGGAGDERYIDTHGRRGAFAKGFITKAGDVIRLTAADWAVNQDRLDSSGGAG